jgi:hypothetical protein
MVEKFFSPEQKFVQKKEGDFYSPTEFLLYSDANGRVKVEVFLHNENIWLTQDRIAELFAVDRTVITKHIKNIYAEEELEEVSTSAKMAQVQKEGNREVKRQITYYNLDAIIAVGYRVNSKQATHFRIWASQILKEYIIKGFAMDDERLKDPRQIFGKDYFEEQLARIRDIRSSERRLYQKITDIYALCSADYSVDSDITQTFFATVQNKLHFAITGKTAAEIIHERVDSTQENMGLTVWKNSPKGKIRESDVTIAKNYLKKEELNDLNRIVTMYLDFAEVQANRGIIMYMKDWVAKLDAFLKFNEKEILSNAGSISHEVAEILALKEYKKYWQAQDEKYISDFDREIQQLLSRETQ